MSMINYFKELKKMEKLNRPLNDEELRIWGNWWGIKVCLKIVFWDTMAILFGILLFSLFS